MALDRGDLRAATEWLGRAVEARHDGWEMHLPAATTLLGETLIEAGDLEAAQALVEIAADSRWDDSILKAMRDHLRAHVELAGGRFASAYEQFLDLGEQWLAFGVSNPASSDWRSCAARAAARIDKLGEATELVQEEIRLAKAFGSPAPVGRALLAAHEVLGDADAQLLEEALAVLEDSADLLLRAHVLVAFGASVRRAGRPAQARERLRIGLDLAARCGARPLQELAEAELRAAGGRPRRIRLSGLDSLTASEQRVAEAAVRGLTTRQIAESLFLSSKTIEWHLRNIYSKLDVNSREGLMRCFADAERSSSA